MVQNQYWNVGFCCGFQCCFQGCKVGKEVYVGVLQVEYYDVDIGQCIVWYVFVVVIEVMNNYVGVCVDCVIEVCIEIGVDVMFWCKNGV